MEEIINKLDALSREITKFVIDNELNEEPLFSAFDKENNLDLEKIKEKKRALKLKEKQELKLRISKLEEEINEL